MTEYQKKGYDDFLELWCLYGYSPSDSQCPARYMKPKSKERLEYIQGWNKAKKEATGA